MRPEEIQLRAGGVNGWLCRTGCLARGHQRQEPFIRVKREQEWISEGMCYDYDIGITYQVGVGSV